MNEYSSTCASMVARMEVVMPVMWCVADLCDPLPTQRAVGRRTVPEPGQGGGHPTHVDQEVSMPRVTHFGSLMQLVSICLKGSPILRSHFILWHGMSKKLIPFHKSGSLVVTHLYCFLQGSISGRNGRGGVVQHRVSPRAGAGRLPRHALHSRHLRH